MPFSGMKHLVLLSLQTDVLPDLSTNSTVQYICLNHKMSGNVEENSSTLKVC